MSMALGFVLGMQAGANMAQANSIMKQCPKYEIQLTRQDNKNIKKIEAKLNMSSKSNAVSAALAMISIVASQLEDGDALCIRSKSGEIRLLSILGLTSRLVIMDGTRE